MRFLILFAAQHKISQVGRQRARRVQECNLYRHQPDITFSPGTNGSNLVSSAGESVPAGDVSVLALSDRIAGVARDGRPKGSLSIMVQKTDGRSVTVEATDPIGSPEKPLTNAQLEAKFRDCAGNAVRPLSDGSVDGVLAAIDRQ